jgi:hypothetical protein
MADENSRPLRIRPGREEGSGERTLKTAYTNTLIYIQSVTPRNRVKDIQDQTERIAAGAAREEVWHPCFSLPRRSMENEPFLE